MADQKLTDKTQIDNIDAGDWIHLVDISDTTSDPQGTSKKATLTQLSNSIVLPPQTVDTGLWPGQGVSLSQSSVAHDLFYVTLSPGKWWLSFSGGTYLPTGGATTGFTQGAMWLGTTSGNTSQDLYAGDTGCYSPVEPVVGTMSPLVMAGKIYDITTTSNIYLKARAIYSTQTGLLAFGHIRGYRLGD